MSMTDFTAWYAVSICPGNPVYEAFNEAFQAGEASKAREQRLQQHLLAGYAKELGLPSLTVGDLINSHRRLRTEAVMERVEERASLPSMKTDFQPGDDLL